MTDKINYSRKILIKLALILLIIHYYTCKPNDEINNIKTKSSQSAPSIDQSGNVKKLLEAISTLFVSGLFDKSFFITAFMATKYSKFLVMISAGISLSIVGVLSVFLGVTINKFVPAIWIDIFSVALFLFFGIKMTLEGLQMPKNEDLIKLEDVHRKIIENSTTDQEHDKLIIRGNENVSFQEVHKECNDLISEQTDKNYQQLNVFFKIFILIFASEIGDRSQISTIYLTNNFDKIIVIIAVLVAQNLLTVIAVLFGVLISHKISERNLTVIAGSSFLIFGFIVLYLVFTNEVLLNMKVPTDIHDDLIPDKKILPLF